MVLRYLLSSHVWLLTLFVLSVSMAFAQSPGGSSVPPKGGKYWVYVGTYTGGGAEGIYLLELDTSNGALTPKGLAARVTNPSFLAVHPDEKHLYAVGEVEKVGTTNGGSVSALAVDAKTGALTPFNQQSSRGGGPCHLVVDRSGKAVLVANYGGGSVAALPIQADGRLGPASSFVQHTGSSVNPQRQEGPHAHSVNVDPGNRHAYVADLGLDKILIYDLDSEKAGLSPSDPPSASTAAGAGPRHFAFDPSGRYAYAINELNSTVTAFTHDPNTGALTKIQEITTLPADFKGQNHPAEVVVHPSGKFVYGSNRGHDSIAVFSIDPSTGRLTTVEQTLTQGKNPRNFAIDPTGSYLLAENSETDTIVVFAIDQQTGRLTPTGAVVKVSKPVCARFVLQRS